VLKKRQTYFVPIPILQEDGMQQAMKQQKRYVYSIQKGGGTKTTKTLHYAIAGTQSGSRVLAVDDDHAQGNITSSFGYNKFEIKHSLYTVIVGKSSLKETVLPTYYDPHTGIFFDPHNTNKMQELGIASLDQAKRGPDLLPMNPNHCKGQSYQLIQQGNWGNLLRDVLDDLPVYQEMHIDTNPDIEGTIFPSLAVYAGTDIVIPLAPEAWPVDGVIALGEWLMQARKVNRNFKIAGIIFSRIRYGHHNQAIDITKTQIVPKINAMIQDLRGQDDKLARQLEGLSFSCFEHMDSESKIYGEEMLQRSTLLTAPPRAKKSEIAPVLDIWSCYIELLQKSERDFREAGKIYNSLFEQYEQARN
jgi:cellulose biosynthesis protein BcsQ